MEVKRRSARVRQKVDIKKSRANFKKGLKSKNERLAKYLKVKQRKKLAKLQLTKQLTKLQTRHEELKQVEHEIVCAKVRRSERIANYPAWIAERQRLADLAKAKLGILVGRTEYKSSHGHVVTGSRTTCLADAVAMAMQIPNGPVRVFMGEQYTWSRANECVKCFQPGWSLVSANQSLQQPGGLELTLLKQSLGKYIMMMTYFQDGIKRYHCAFFDAGEKWKREYHVKGWLFGHGVLKDNQADVGIHYSEDVDRESVASARGFFQGPYKLPMRIESVWLMSKDKKSNHDRNDNEASGDSEQHAPSVRMECPDDDGDLKVAACDEAL